LACTNHSKKEARKDLDQPTGNPKDLFDAIVAHVELSKRVREFDNVDHNGNNVPAASQIHDAKAILAKAKELRRLIS
jgi:hypothetical protein